MSVCVCVKCTFQQQVTGSHWLTVGDGPSALKTALPTILECYREVSD